MWALGQELFMSEEGSHNTFNFLHRYLASFALGPHQEAAKCILQL